MMNIKKENDEFYLNGSETRNKFVYGRAAYEKATENEKRIAIGNRTKQIDEIRSIVEKESIKGLKGETIEKAIKFTSSGGIIETEITVSPENLDVKSTIDVYLNGKLVGSAGADEGNHGLFSMRSKDGENILHFVIGDVIPHVDFTITVSGKIEKTESLSEIDYLGKDYYAVKRDDKIVIYHYTGSDFETLYTLCGLKNCSAVFIPDKGFVYLSAKFYSGKTVAYEVWDDGETIIFLDDSVDFASCGLYYGYDTLWLYYVVGGTLRLATFNDNWLLCEEGAFLKGVKEISVFNGRSGAAILVKDFHDRYSVLNVKGMNVSDRLYIGKVCSPHIPYGNPDIVICKNGSETSAGSGCYSINIAQKTPGIGKPYKDCYPVTLSEDFIVGLENGEPIILGKNLNE